MDTLSLKQRLRHQLHVEGWTSLGLGLGLLLLTALAFLITFWGIYALGMIFGVTVRGSRSALVNDWMPWLALVVTILLFPLHALLDPQEAVELEVHNPAESEGPSLVLSASRRQETDAGLDPDSARDAFRYVLGVFFFAPLLARLAIEAIQKGIHLLRLDMDRLAPVFEVLLSRPSRVPLAELFHLFPQLNPQCLARALGDIEGIVLLPSFPAGLTLTGDLRDELQGVTESEAEPAAWPESEERPAGAEESGVVTATRWETDPAAWPQPKWQLSELALTLIVRFTCGCLLGLGAFCWILFGPRRHASSGASWSADWFQHPSLVLPLISILGGGVICVLTTPRWMWRGGLG